MTWTEKTLGDLIQLQRGHDLPMKARTPGIYPVVGSNGILSRHEEARYAAPGVLIGRSGVIGGSIFVNEPYWPLNTTLFVRDFRGNDPRWVYYLLKNIDFSGFNSGSAQPSLNRNYIAGIELQVPTYSEQCAIAATLGALDDKIESNRRQRALLRELGHCEYEAAISSGRKSVPLSELTFSIARGVAPKYADSDPDAPRVINQKCIRDGWVSLQPSRRMVDRAVKVEKRASSGDILVNSTGTGTLGRVARWHAGDIFVDGHVTVVKPNAKVIPPTVLAYSLLGRESDIEDLATGSTGQTELSPSRLSELSVMVPAANDLARLEDSLIAVENRCYQLAEEMQRLIDLRDALLPELLSGRIRAADVEVA